MPSSSFSSASSSGSLSGLASGRVQSLSEEQYSLRGGRGRGGKTGEVGGGERGGKKSNIIF